MHRLRRALRLCFSVVGFAAVVILTAGCAVPQTPGFLFTHVTTPVDLNFNETPIHDPTTESERHTIRYYVSFDWADVGLGESAKKAGFSRIHYADLETLTVLGIYTQQTIHIYGER